VHNDRVVVTQERRGLGLSACERADGEPRWRVELGFLPTTAAWITVDDAMNVNIDNGSIVSSDMRDGHIRWRRVGEQDGAAFSPGPHLTLVKS